MFRLSLIFFGLFSKCSLNVIVHHSYIYFNRSYCSLFVSFSLISDIYFSCILMLS